MLKLRLTYSLVAVIFVLANAFGQVTTGTPPLGSFGGGPFDTVNLGNLNVHFSIPVVSKAGRGMPFTYALSYDSSIWTQVTSNGVTSWFPTANWGWRGDTEIATGYVSYDYSGTLCDPRLGKTLLKWSNFVYHDPFGTSHAVGGLAEIDQCQNTKYNLASTARDGSDYTIYYYVDGSGTDRVTSRSGSVINPPFGSSTGAGTATDANGNQVTTDGSGKFYDTLSGTTPVLTVAGTSPKTFTYTSPSGNKAYSLNYSPQNVWTSFGCGIGEYQATNVSMVSSIGLPDGTEYTFTYEQNTSHSGYITGRLASVKLPTGGTISYTYTGANSGIVCADGSTLGLSRTTPDSSTAWTYSRSGSGSTWTTTVTDPLTNETIVDFEKDNSTTNPTSNFFETQRVVKDGSNTLSTTITCYNGVNVGTPSSCYNTAVTSPIARATVFHYLPTSSGSQSETDTDYNSNGLVTDVYDYDYLTGSVGGLLRHTHIAYATLGNGIVDRPSSASTYDGGGSLKANTQYTYDEGSVTASGATQHISISGSRGNLTTVAAQASGTATLYRKFTYYDTGILQTSSDVSATNASTNPTTYNYSNSAASCDFAFPTSITEPVSLSRSMTWDCNGGVLLSLTDENGKISSTAYSGSAYSTVFWRPYSSTDQSGNTTYFTYPSATQTESKLSFNSSVVDHLTTVDGLGRPSISQTEQGPGSGNYDSVESTYDANGRLYKVTMPYVATSGQSCSGTCPGTSYGYDTLNRVISVTDGGGGYTNSAYTNNDVLQTVGPAPLRKKQLQYDGLGRLGSVCELTSSGGGACAQTNGQTGFWTKYTPDALGNLTGVTQNAQGSPTQTRSYNYDMLGRMTSEGNPESGTTTYYWDAAPTGCGSGGWSTPGDLGAKKDQAGVYTCNGYDGLHRLLGFSHANGTQCSTFVYDAATPPTGVSVSNTKGRLINAYTNSACNGRTSLVTDRWLGYSPRGEVTDIYSSTPNSGGYYHTTKTYWPHGAVKSLAGIPGVPTIYYGASDASGLDGEGRVTKVTASSGTNPVTAVTYGGTGQPVGSLTAVTYGSSDFDNFSYDTGTGRMTGYQFNIGTSGQAVVGTLNWNQNGTLHTLGIVDPFNSSDNQTCTYGYDDLGRVNSVGCGTPWAQTFSYDAFGNISKAGTSSFQAGYVLNGVDNNRIQSLPGFTPTYDADGNLTSDNFHTYQWNPEGRPTVIDGTSNATYDAMGNMVELSQPSWLAQYLYDENGYEYGLSHAGGNAFATLPLPGGGRVQYSAGALENYGHVDWLGSARLTSGSSRTYVGGSAGAPYGEEYAVHQGQDVQGYFAGIGRNIAVDLWDATHREYHAVQGRWVSPDPAGRAAVDPSNPQTWNRYAYVTNNPLSNIDPLGLDIVACWGFDCGGVGGGGGCMGFTDGAGYPGENCGPFTVYLPVGPGGGGGGGGGSAPRSPSPPPGGGGSHGPWPGNETTGLPQLPTQAVGLGDLLGLNPNGPCDFGVCVPIGNNIAPAAVAAVPCLLDPVCAAVVVGVTVVVTGIELYKLHHHTQTKTKPGPEIDEACELFASKFDGKETECMYHCSEMNLQLCSKVSGRCPQFAMSNTLSPCD